jgi:hypothetical protein
MNNVLEIEGLEGVCRQGNRILLLLLYLNVTLTLWRNSQMTTSSHEGFIWRFVSTKPERDIE